MMKEVFSCAGGIVVGVAICYGGYRLYQYYRKQDLEKERKFSAEILKEKEKSSQKLKELIKDQTYVELLTARELTKWFRENRSRVDGNARMVIMTPTDDYLRGLGYPAENQLDIETNLLQLFYDDETGSAIMIRLINYTDIESNLQAKLMEQDGMIIVTD